MQFVQMQFVWIQFVQMQFVRIGCFDFFTQPKFQIPIYFTIQFMYSDLKLLWQFLIYIDLITL
jgi:hypothetical protein